MIIEAGPVKEIHVSQNNIRANNKGQNLGCILVNCDGAQYQGSHLVIRGPSQVIQRMESHIKAVRVFIETKSEIHLTD